MTTKKQDEPDTKQSDSKPTTRPPDSSAEPKSVAKGTTVAEQREQGDEVGETVASKNIDGDESDAFTKQFVLKARDFGAGYDHTPNFTGTTQEAVNVGLRVTGDVEYVGSEPHPDGKSVVLTYRVPVLPAWHEDAPVNVIDAQEVWRDGVTPADERTPVDPEQLSPRTGDARYTEAGEDPERVREKGKPAPGTPAAEESSSK
ncbi:MAG TPA: hypothetical protein VM430_18885 [Microbacterium sp.]|nr:hypothetical protein [Microbacterium sp.]